MALSIKDPATEKLARDYAAATGLSITKAIKQALADKMAEKTRQQERSMEERRKAVDEILKRFDALAIEYTGNPHEAIEYDEWGLPV